MSSRGRILFIVLLFVGAIGGSLLLDRFANPPKLQSIYDDMGAVSPQQRVGLKGRLDWLNRSTGGLQVVVYFTGSLRGEAIETFANRKFGELGLGEKGVDNGLLLVVALPEKQARLEVGYGLEDQVTDAYSHQLLRELKPTLDGDYVNGVDHLLYSIDRTVHDPRPAHRPLAIESVFIYTVFMFFVFIATVGVWDYFRTRRMSLARAETIRAMVPTRATDEMIDGLLASYRTRTGFYLLWVLPPVYIWFRHGEAISAFFAAVPREIDAFWPVMLAIIAFMFSVFFYIFTFYANRSFSKKWDRDLLSKLDKPNRIKFGHWLVGETAKEDRAMNQLLATMEAAEGLAGAGAAIAGSTSGSGRSSSERTKSGDGGRSGGGGANT